MGNLFSSYASLIMAKLALIGFTLLKSCSAGFLRANPQNVTSETEEGKAAFFHVHVHGCHYDDDRTLAFKMPQDRRLEKIAATGGDDKEANASFFHVHYHSCHYDDNQKVMSDAGEGTEEEANAAFFHFHVHSGCHYDENNKRKDIMTLHDGRRLEEVNTASKDEEANAAFFHFHVHTC